MAWYKYIYILLTWYISTVELHYSDAWKYVRVNLLCCKHAQMHWWLQSLNTKCCHEANFVITGNTAGCRNDNLQWSQWWQSWHHGNSWFKRYHDANFVISGCTAVDPVMTKVTTWKLLVQETSWCQLCHHWRDCSGASHDKVGNMKTLGIQVL